MRFASKTTMVKPLAQLRLMFVISLIWLMTACVPAPAPNATTVTSIPDIVVVQSLNLIFQETFPLELEIVITGTLPNACHSLDPFTVEQAGEQFTIPLTSTPSDAIDCAPAPAPFQETVPLDIYGLSAGIYTVDVNRALARFELPIDNAPVPTPVPDNRDASISGVVWHDICAIRFRDDGSIEPSLGCTPLGGDAYTGDGLRTAEEPPLESIFVILLAGRCSEDPPQIAYATTDTEGRFTFSGLPGGMYCVVIDPLFDQNVGQLIPGDWTAPAPGENAQTISLFPSEQKSGIDYGWDYQLLPSPEQAPFPTPIPTATTNAPTAAPTPAPTPTTIPREGCEEGATFEEDITIPDDTVFAAGETFIKVWRIRNTGTCPWTTEYSIAFMSGAQMGAPGNVPLPGLVVPGETIDISVTFAAPTAAGTYRSNWFLRDLVGETFGVGDDLDDFFWVQIVVE